MLFKAQMGFASKSIRIRTDRSLKVFDLRRASRPRAVLDDGVIRRCLLVFISTTPGTLSLSPRPTTRALTASSCGSTNRCQAIFSTESGEGSKVRSGRKSVNGTLVPYGEMRGSGRGKDSCSAGVSPAVRRRPAPPPEARQLPPGGAPEGRLPRRPPSVYMRLAGGIMLFMRRYSTICP